MLTLVYGGSASGKSEFAEDLALAAGEPRYYVATMEPFGPEAAQRIARHRAMRAQKGFCTLERYCDLAGLTLPGPGVVLLECLGNLVAGELYSPGGAGSRGALSALVEGVQALEKQALQLIVVTNDVFGHPMGEYEASTLEYLNILGRANHLLAQGAQQVWEVVCGIPLPQKGARP